jgi:hypothetical protein
VARDTANQPWLARDLGSGEFVFDALPPGRYTVDVDVSGIEEPLKMRSARVHRRRASAKDQSC